MERRFISLRFPVLRTQRGGLSAPLRRLLTRTSLVEQMVHTLRIHVICTIITLYRSTRLSYGDCRMEGLFGNGVGDTRNGVEEDLVVGGFDHEWRAIRWRYGDL